MIQVRNLDLHEESARERINTIRIFICLILNEKITFWEFPGSPVVRTLCSKCRGPGSDPWLGN